MNCYHHFLPLALAFYLAPPEIFLASCLSLNDLFFLLIITLNLSKSVKLALLALTANFFDCAVAAHFSLSLNSFAAILNFLLNLKSLRDGAWSGSLENLWYSETGESESSKWVENTGESSLWVFDEDSCGIGNINNNYNFA